MNRNKQFIVLMLVGVSMGMSLLGSEPSNYNVFVFEDFRGDNSDVEGRVAAGRDIQLTNFNVGCKISSPTSGKKTFHISIFVMNFVIIFVYQFHHFKFVI
jgi:hypothetical protein